jgi:CheY-like chemotaxis protein
MLKPFLSKRVTVLIVEDNADDAEILTRALKKFPTKHCSVVGTAEDALAFLARQRCDVLLIDYHLPAMNGLRLLERVRKQLPGVRTIMVTGVRDEEVAVSAMKLGADDYVRKDEMLTGTIVRSLQAILREQATSEEEELRTAVGSVHDKLTVAGAEAGWLLEPFQPELDSYNGDGADILLSDSPLRAQAAHAHPGELDETQSDARDTVARYLRESFRAFPDPASKEEDAVVRMFVQRGSAPREVVTVYQAALRSLATAAAQLEAEPAFSPTVCLARILARLVEEYQSQLSLGASN